VKVQLGVRREELGVGCGITKCGAVIPNSEFKIPNCAAGFCGISGLYVRVVGIANYGGDKDIKLYNAILI